MDFWKLFKKLDGVLEGVLARHSDFMSVLFPFLMPLGRRIFSILDDRKSGVTGTHLFAFLTLFIVVLPVFFLMLASIPTRLILVVLKAIRPRSRQNRINKAPGSNWLSIVEFLYSPKTVEETFKQIVADWRTEYFEALKQGRTCKARWISIRYTFSFIMSMSLSKVYALFKSFKSVGK
jgi:hypothetical protein